MKVLVTGAGGQLGREIVELATRRGDEVVGAEHRLLPVENPEAVSAVLGRHAPELVIHAAALTNVDYCEEHPAEAEAVNAIGTALVAAAAGGIGAHLVYISTDYVFDGRASRPYRETDPTHPLSVYGATKLAGEKGCPPGATIVRTSWVAGAHGPNFVRTVLELAAGPGELHFVDDQRASPTFTADLADAVMALGKDRRSGCFHVSNGGEASRYELAREVLSLVGADPRRAVAISTAELHPARAAPRPAYSVLDNAAFVSAGYRALPPWQTALASLLVQLGRRAT